MATYKEGTSLSEITKNSPLRAFSPSLLAPASRGSVTPFIIRFRQIKKSISKPEKSKFPSVSQIQTSSNMHLVSFFHFKTKTKSVVYIYGAKFKNCTMCTENRKTGFIDIWGVLEGSNTLSNHQRPLHVVLSKSLILRFFVILCPFGDFS